jgi:hypothetical protein
MRHFATVIRHMATVAVVQPEEKQVLLTRSGYEVSEVFQAFRTSLGESGANAIGRALHFGIELVCSDGLEIWKKVCWEYAIFHVGLASPRIFVYLRKRFSELEALVKKYPNEHLYRDEEFQTRISEIIYVLHGCPRRASVKWPAIGHETHQEGWLRLVKQAPEVAAVSRVWRHESDMPAMRTAACELVKACTEGATEKALFWVRWLLEEDSLVRKSNMGRGMTTMERGPANLNSKKRTDQGYFLLAVFAEVYKDLAAKNVVRMHEEFQCLLDIWRDPSVHFTMKQKREILGLIVLLLAEVPKWKVPAAPSLVKDPIQLSRAVGQCFRFFLEILQYPPVSSVVVKAGAKKRPVKRIKETDKGKMNLEQHLAAYDQAINSYLGLD